MQGTNLAADSSRPLSAPRLPPPQLVPALSKWGGATVGLTLLAIGVLGIYESFFEEHHDDHYHGHGEETAGGWAGRPAEPHRVRVPRRFTRVRWAGAPWLRESVGLVPHRALSSAMSFLSACRV